MAAQNPPTLGGRYELQRRLAQGGMATVYLAMDRQLDRQVAIKMLHPQFASDPTFAERLRREARAAAGLSHPNIVGVYDWGRHGERYFIVMEYVSGHSLAEIIAARGPLDPKAAAAIAFEVAAALAFAHRAGIVHRDVKPQNVLLSSDGHVKVTDFGIATMMGGGPSLGLTETGTVVGTAAYLSPEQAQGEATDARSDLYSLGVVLYEMLAGYPPFRGDTPISVAYQHVAGSAGAPHRDRRRGPPGARDHHDAAARQGPRRPLRAGRGSATPPADRPASGSNNSPRSLPPSLPRLCPRRAPRRVRHRLRHRADRWRRAHPAGATRARPHHRASDLPAPRCAGRLRGGSPSGGPAVSRRPAARRDTGNDPAVTVAGAGTSTADSSASGAPACSSWASRSCWWS